MRASPRDNPPAFRMACPPKDDRATPANEGATTTNSHGLATWPGVEIADRLVVVSSSSGMAGLPRRCGPPATRCDVRLQVGRRNRPRSRGRIPSPFLILNDGPQSVVDMCTFGQIVSWWATTGCTHEPARRSSWLGSGADPMGRARHGCCEIRTARVHGAALAWCPQRNGLPGDRITPAAPRICLSSAP